MMRVWQRVRVLGLCLMAMAVVGLLRPQPTFACGYTDIGCDLQVLLHQQLVTNVTNIWLINRSLLLLARAIESLREWLLGDVLATAFTATLRGVQSLFWMTAIVALILFMVSYMLQAIIDLRWVDVRKALRNGLIAYVLFVYGSQALGATEQLRVGMGQFFQDAAQQAVGAASDTLDFHVQNDATIPANPSSIYAGSNDCPGNSTKRTPAGMYLNDYAANFLRADAVDIHCPPSIFTLPLDRGDESFTKIYVDPPDVSDLEPQPRAEAIARVWNGGIQMIMGIMLSFAAVLEQVMHLMFVVATAAVWLGLVISLLFVLFLPTEGLFTTQVSMLRQILVSSWLSSFWVGLALAAMRQATATGNALMVAGFGLLVILVVIWQIKVAGGVLMQAAESATMVMGNAPQAVGGVAKGLGNAALNAGLSAGAMATGGTSAIAGSMVRQHLAKAGTGTLGRASARHLGNKAAKTIGQLAARRDGVRGTDAANGGAATDGIEIEGSARDASWYDQERSVDDLKQERNSALREQRWDDAHSAIRQIRSRSAAAARDQSSAEETSESAASPQRARRSSTSVQRRPRITVSPQRTRPSVSSPQSTARAAAPRRPLRVGTPAVRVAPRATRGTQRTTRAKLREPRNDTQNALVPVVDERAWVEREMRAAPMRGDETAFRGLRDSRDATRDRMSDPNGRDQAPNEVHQREQQRRRERLQAADSTKRNGNTPGAQQLNGAAARIRDRITPTPMRRPSAREQTIQGVLNRSRVQYDQQVVEWEHVRRTRGEAAARPWLAKAEATLATIIPHEIGQNARRPLTVVPRPGGIPGAGGGQLAHRPLRAASAITYHGSIARRTHAHGSRTDGIGSTGVTSVSIPSIVPTRAASSRGSGAAVPASVAAPNSSVPAIRTTTIPVARPIGHAVDGMSARTSTPPLMVHRRGHVVRHASSAALGAAPAGTVRMAHLPLAPRETPVSAVGTETGALAAGALPVPRSVPAGAGPLASPADAQQMPGAPIPIVLSPSTSATAMPLYHAARTPDITGATIPLPGGSASVPVTIPLAPDALPPAPAVVPVPEVPVTAVVPVPVPPVGPTHPEFRTTAALTPRPPAPRGAAAMDVPTTPAARVLRRQAPRQLSQRLTRKERS